MNPQEIARLVSNAMTDYEAYCRAHRGRVAAYASHTQTLTRFLTPTRTCGLWESKSIIAPRQLPLFD